MDSKNKGDSMLTVGILSGCLLTFLLIPNGWGMSDTEKYWNRTMATGEEEELTSPKNVPAPKPPDIFQPQKQDQEPPVIDPPITDPEMVLPPPVTDPEMVVIPERTAPTEEEKSAEKANQKMAP
jgi:hypothetical protein